MIEIDGFENRLGLEFLLLDFEILAELIHELFFIGILVILIYRIFLHLLHHCCLNMLSLLILVLLLMNVKSLLYLMNLLKEHWVNDEVLLVLTQEYNPSSSLPQ